MSTNYSQKTPSSRSAGGTMPLLQLAQALTDQPWADIGQREGVIHGIKDEDEIIYQLVSILALRLDVLMTSRKNKDLSTAAITESIRNGLNRRSTIVGTTAESELHLFVSRIALMYRDVGYHALEHAAHVTMSLNKIVSLVIEHGREEENGNAEPVKPQARSSSLPDSHAKEGNEVSEIDRITSTFGIGRDPLTQFVLLFAGLIHDVDHSGVPNKQLIEEGDDLAMLYNDRSVAEQHSLSVAFTMLLKPEFAELRHVIFPTAEDRKLFRKIVIDLVLCTDIANPERMQVGKSKWKEAFEVSPTNFQRPAGSRGCGRRHSVHHDPEDRSHIYRLGIKRALHLNGSSIELYPPSIEGEIKLKASTVLEQIIQAADVAHTMQSWENFLKWNKRLYDEQWNAFMEGRGDDPSDGWYKNQISFYDFYILPLARRLLQCGVFGDHGYDFLHLAQENRRRWLLEGDEICESLIDFYENRKKEGKVKEENGSSRKTFQSAVHV